MTYRNTFGCTGTSTCKIDIKRICIHCCSAYVLQFILTDDSLLQDVLQTKNRGFLSECKRIFKICTVCQYDCRFQNIQCFFGTCMRLSDIQYTIKSAHINSSQHPTHCKAAFFQIKCNRTAWFNPFCKKASDYTCTIL